MDRTLNFDSFLTHVHIAWTVVTDGLTQVLLDPYSPLGIYALVSVPLLMFVALKLGRVHDYNGLIDPKHRNDRSLRGFHRWLLPKKLITSKSTLQDIKISLTYLAFSGPLVLLTLPIFGYENILKSFDAYNIVAVLSPSLAEMVKLNPHQLKPIESSYLINFLYVLGLLISVNFGYWVSHYSMHKLPFLWEFHKIHHAAEHLSGFTYNRQHIFDAVYWEVCGALSMTAAVVLFNWTLGYTPMGEENTAIFYIYYFMLSPIYYFFHSPYWISFGKFEYVFTSPAMHTIHHSKDPKHFDKNFGNDLSIWDTIFGTAFRTEKIPPADLKIGIDDPIDWNRVSLWTVIYLPILQSAAHFKIIKKQEKRPIKDDRPSEKNNRAA